MVGNIAVGDESARANDVLGRVYEYFLGQFAGAEGKKGGEFYTPRCVVRPLVEMLEPYSGRVYDPRWKYGVPPRATPTSAGYNTTSTILHRRKTRASCSPTVR